MPETEHTSINARMLGRLEELRRKALAPEILAFEEDLRTKLGERAVQP